MKKIVLFVIVLLGVFLSLFASPKCRAYGCNRYPLTNGYCGLHQDEDSRGRNRFGGYQSDERRECNKPRHKKVVEEKFTLDSIKAKHNEFNIYASFDTSDREWVDVKNKKLIGTWTTCTEDNQSIYIKDFKTERYINVALDKLSPADKGYAQKKINEFVAKGYKWWDGCYFTLSQMINIKKGEEAVLKRSSLTPTNFKVFQVVEDGALAHEGRYSEYYNSYKYDGDLFYLSQDIDGVVTDTGEYHAQLFWATTYKYTNRINDTRVVQRYTTIFPRAVMFARAKLYLYDKDDPDYVMFERMNGNQVNSKPQIGSGGSTNISASEAMLACSGSGFFITKDGYLITNHHVVEGGKRFDVLTSNGTMPAQLIKTDAETDLALLKVDGIVRNCSFSTKRREPLGAEVFTMGFPQPDLQGFSPKVTKGIISGVEGFKGDVREYQIDATIQPGNSGGPLLDMSGNVVGVLVASLRNGQSVNYAIKKSYVLAFLDGSADCADKIEERESGADIQILEDIVYHVRDACVLVRTYK